MSWEIVFPHRGRDQPLDFIDTAQAAAERLGDPDERAVARELAL